MKIVYPLIILLLSACSSYDYVVDSDYNYRGNFDRYKTFAFAQNEGFGGTVADKDLIEKYLQRTLNSWGYDLQDRKPNLVIFYTLYFDDLKFRGYAQPEFISWIRENYGNKDLIYKKDTLDNSEDSYSRFYSNKDESYDRERLELREGTILISMFDRRKQATVWQGYASGVFGEDKERNERVIKSAIIRILDEYRVLAFQSS